MKGPEAKLIKLKEEIGTSTILADFNTPFIVKSEQVNKFSRERRLNNTITQLDLLGIDGTLHSVMVEYTLTFMCTLDIHQDKKKSGS